MGSPSERRDEPPSGAFDGQFVSIVKKSNPNSSTDLEKVQVRKVDGRAFIVGIGADVPDNWQKGRTVWVALDDVSEVTVFATLEELRKAGTPGEVKKEGQALTYGPIGAIGLMEPLCPIRPMASHWRTSTESLGLALPDSV